MQDITRVADTRITRDPSCSVSLTLSQARATGFSPMPRKPVVRKSSVKLPLRYRRHALARLDAVIAAAERDRAEHLAAVKHLAAAGKSTARPRAKLRISDHHLALLHRSRGWLALGELPQAVDQGERR